LRLTSVICTAQVDAKGRVVAYATAAGSDTTSGTTPVPVSNRQDPCTHARSMAAGTNAVAAICYLTAADDAVTLRVYLTIPGGDAAVS